MRTDLQDLHNKVAHYSAISQQRDRVRYNSGVVPRNFEVGDLVLKKVLHKGATCHLARQIFKVLWLDI